MTTGLKHWIVFATLSGGLWFFVPTNFLLFFPVVIVWSVVTAGVTTFILSLWADYMGDDK